MTGRETKVEARLRTMKWLKARRTAVMAMQ